MDPLSYSLSRRIPALLIVITLLITSCTTPNKVPPAKADDKGPRIPKVFMPGATCETVKEKIDGRRWEQAHLVCTLKDAVWSPE